MSLRRRCVRVHLVAEHDEAAVRSRHRHSSCAGASLSAALRSRATRAARHRSDRSGDPQLVSRVAVSIADAPARTDVDERTRSCRSRSADITSRAARGGRRSDLQRDHRFDRGAGDRQRRVRATEARRRTPKRRGNCASRRRRCGQRTFVRSAAAIFRGTIDSIVVLEIAKDASARPKRGRERTRRSPNTLACPCRARSGRTTKGGLAAPLWRPSRRSERTARAQQKRPAAIPNVVRRHGSRMERQPSRVVSLTVVSLTVVSLSICVGGVGIGCTHADSGTRRDVRAAPFGAFAHALDAVDTSVRGTRARVGHAHLAALVLDRTGAARDGFGL